MTTLLNLVLVCKLLLLKSASCQEGPGWLSPTFNDSKCPSKLAEFDLDDPGWFRSPSGGAVFWSTDIMNSSDNMYAAQAWAEANNKVTLELTDGGKILQTLHLFDVMDKADAAVYWNCASQLYARQATGTMHAFSRQLRTHTPWGNGRPTFYNIELVEILNRDANAKIFFHYNANNGRDVWYNSHHYTNCATPAMERYYLFAKYAFAAYDQNGIPYPDYGLDDEWAGEACPP